MSGACGPTGVSSSTWSFVRRTASAPSAQTECVGGMLRTTPGIRKKVRGSRPTHGSLSRLSNTGVSGVTVS